jgi:hypothetical protein
MKQNLCAEFQSQFQNQDKDSVMISTSTQETQLNKNQLYPHTGCN